MIRSASPPMFVRDWRGLAATALRHLESVPRPLLDLLLRVGVAGVFWRSGMLKLQSWEFTVFLFRDEYRVPLLPPEFAALLGTAVELVAPVLLVLGLGARLGAGALLGLTFVIQIFVYPTSWPEHLLWAAVLVNVFSNGPGTLSLDHLIRRRLLGGRG
jgi:putative oxidoreductase